MKELALILLSIVMIVITVATGSDSNGESNLRFREVKNLTFNLDQSVTGGGFFAVYKYSKMPDVLGTSGDQFNGVESKSSAHGSGTMDINSQIYAESSYTNESYFTAKYDEEGEPYEELEGTTSIIKLKEDGNMVYNPVSMAIGSKYYSIHPMVFDSLLKDESCIKNRDGLNSMNHRVERAHGLDKTLEAQSDATVISMMADEDLIDGTAHFGVLQLAGIPLDEESEESDSEDEIEILGLAMKTWKKPLIEVDEDYVGSFHITKNMTITTSSEEEEKEESWLPCCSGGYMDMNPLDRRSKNVQGVFDCTCVKVPGQ